MTSDKLTCSSSPLSDSDSDSTQQEMFLTILVFLSFPGNNSMFYIREYQKLNLICKFFVRLHS